MTLNYKIALPDDPSTYVIVKGTGIIDALNRFLDLTEGKDSKPRPITIIGDYVTLKGVDFIVTRL